MYREKLKSKPWEYMFIIHFNWTAKRMQKTSFKCSRGIAYSSGVERIPGQPFSQSAMSLPREDMCLDCYRKSQLLELILHFIFVQKITKMMRILVCYTWRYLHSWYHQPPELLIERRGWIIVLLLAFPWFPSLLSNYLPAILLCQILNEKTGGWLCH